MLAFLEVPQGIQLRKGKWSLTNQLSTTQLNLTQYALVMGKFLNVCTHLCLDEL
jgi:hypothetical protein